MNWQRGWSNDVEKLHYPHHCSISFSKKLPDCVQTGLGFYVCTPKPRGAILLPSNTAERAIYSQFTSHYFPERPVAWKGVALLITTII